VRTWLAADELPSCAVEARVTRRALRGANPRKVVCRARCAVTTAALIRIGAHIAVQAAQRERLPKQGLASPGRARRARGLAVVLGIGARGAEFAGGLASERLLVAAGAIVARQVSREELGLDGSGWALGAGECGLCWVGEAPGVARGSEGVRRAGSAADIFHRRG
jgi:hypothetical protein